MKTILALAVVLALVSSLPLRGGDGSSPAAFPARAAVLRPERTNSSYSAELPVVARTAGNATDIVFFLNPWTAPWLRGQNGLQTTAGLRTSVDLVNNTSTNGVAANFQFSYTCLSAKCSPPGAFYRTIGQQVVLPALGAFHQDDFVQYLANLGLLQPGAVDGVLGTLLVTFTNLPSARGWEAGVIGNVYNPIVEADPLLGAVGFAANASLFFDSADTGLVGFARDTTASPTAAGRFQSDVGVRNTDILGTNQNLTVDLSFYDPATGQRVGNILALSDLQPGQLREISDVWGSAGISTAVNAVVVFADVRNPTASSPTIEGYVLWRDTRSRSPRFLTMLCSDVDGCGN